MSTMLPNFIRGLVSAVMNVLMLMSLLQPKYSKMITRLAMLGVMAVDLSTSLFCYASGNLTLLAKMDIVVFTVLCFAVRGLFRESLMQWLFCYISVQNINMAVVILSFSTSRLMPYPVYANSAIRIILFSGMLFLLHRYVRPLYRQMVEHWNVFFYVAAAISAAFAYSITGSNNIVHTLTKDSVQLNLLVLVAAMVYISVCHSLKTLSKEYALREENLKMQSNHEILRLSASAMAERLKLMDEAAYKSSIVAHDRRHFNSMVLELLEQGQTEAAITFLRQQGNIMPPKVRKYCENTAVNATVCYYASLAEQKGIAADIMLDIPSSIMVDSLEFSMVLANLLENAIHSCEALSKESKRYFRLICRNVGRLILEMSNSCDNTAILDENGYPVAKEVGHGTGTKSVLAFAAQHDAEIIYSVENGIFRVRMVI